MGKLNIITGKQTLSTTGNGVLLIPAYVTQYTYDWEYSTPIDTGSCSNTTSVCVEAGDVGNTYIVCSTRASTNLSHNTVASCTTGSGTCSSLGDDGTF